METFVSSGIMIKRAVLSSDVQREKSYLFAGGSSPEEEAVKIYSSGTVTSQAATISHAVITQGGNNSMYISSGRTANYTSAGSGGLIYIYDGGTANNTSVRNGWLTIFNGGTANSTAVFSGGILDIYEGGSADSTFVYSDAGLYVN